MKIILAGLVLTVVGCDPPAVSVSPSTQPVAASMPAGPPALKATQAQAMPFTFIQVGDPQIGGWTDVENTQHRMLQLVDIINQTKPAFAIVVGDLVTGGANARQIKAFDECLARFRVPAMLIPGNHDDMATYYAKYGPDYYSFTYANCEFVCINSNLFASLTPSKQTRVAAERQWKFMEDTLADAQKKGRAHIFIVMHHTPASAPMGLARLEKLISTYHVEVVLCGHIHRTEEYHHKTHTVYTVAGTGWTGDRRGYGYRVFTVRPDKIEQEYRTIDQPATQPAK